ncbi:MAG: hypothetical protein B6U89_00380 [Desulfurococcales archaeon ex4484_58]|nr:MAG: hypothetical protein B6U89_00380 [Desulfurococcales archaeon ex4484_58]
MSKRQVIDLFINYVRENRESLFERTPEDVVKEVMDMVKRYGEFVKYYLKLHWKGIEQLLSDPSKLLEEIKESDQEVYNIITQHLDWFYSFIDKLYNELKNHLS